MSENLLEAAGKPAPQGPAFPEGRPEGIPEKFWDAERGEIRVEALLKSYRELERRMSQRLTPPGPDADPEEKRRWREAHDIPEGPEDYVVEPRHELTSPDIEVNRRLYEAGFSRAQVQLVYDLATERLLPLIAEAAQQFEAERQLERLHERFGGADRYRRVAAQLSAWGRANLPHAVFEALSTTVEGVLALERMMQGKEPQMTREAMAPESSEEGDLRRMMRDPRYWRRREPEMVRRVTEGFRRLAGG